MKKYLIYESRYMFEPKKALIMEVCNTKEEAEAHKKDHGDDCVVVEEEV